MKHKHCEVIKAWADGKQIQAQYPSLSNSWIDTDSPAWSMDTNYRVKSETLKYRVALLSGGETFTTNTERFEARLEKSPSFKRWLTDWVEVEV